MPQPGLARQVCGNKPSVCSWCVWPRRRWSQIRAKVAIYSRFIVNWNPSHSGMLPNKSDVSLRILSHQIFVGNWFRFDSCVGTSLEFKPSCNHVWRLFGMCFRGSATAQRSCKRTGGSCKCLPYSFLTTATAKTRVTSAVPSWYFSAPSAPSGSHTPLLLMLAQMRESGRR